MYSCWKLPCSLISYIGNPLLKGQPEQLLDSSFRWKLFSLFITYQSSQYMHPEEEGWHGVIGTTHVLNRMGYINIPGELTQTDDIPIYIHKV